MKKRKEMFTLEWKCIKSELLPEANQLKCVGKVEKLDTRPDIQDFNQSVVLFRA